MSISALIFAGTIYRLELICHSLKVFCCMIRQHFYWFTTNFVELPQMHTFVKNVMFTAFQNHENGMFLFYVTGHSVQSNLAISNSVNSKSLLFRRKIECPWIYPSPLRFPCYFEAPLFRTFFHFPWDFEIVGFDCTYTWLIHTLLVLPLINTINPL